MSNNGKKFYTTLIKVDQFGNPTGESKINTPIDPDYIPPVVDVDLCPIPTTTTTTTEEPTTTTTSTSTTTTTSTTSTTTTTTTEDPDTRTFLVENSTSYPTPFEVTLFDQVTLDPLGAVEVDNVDPQSFDYIGDATNQSRIWITYPIDLGTVSVKVYVYVDLVEVYNDNSDTVNDIFINDISPQSNIEVKILPYGTIL